jgi:hypothetical protein
MSEGFRSFKVLVSAAKGLAGGLAKEIPVVGPAIKAMLDQIENDDLKAEMRRLSRLLEIRATLESAQITADQLDRDLTKIVRIEPRLTSVILPAIAEASDHFAKDRPPAEEGGAARRFLYLAARTYANSTKTAEIAANLGFLWRSYHNIVGAAVNKVGQIRVGDVVALAYRTPGKQFRILLPLVVTASGDHTGPINDTQCPKHAHAPHAPFVLAGSWLTKVLVSEGYVKPDPVFGGHTGLNVKVLLRQVPQQTFQSPPGNDAIWPCDQQSDDGNFYLPKEVRNWLGKL